MPAGVDMNNLVKAILLLTRCSYFLISPEQRSMINQTATTNTTNRLSDFIITRQQILGKKNEASLDEIEDKLRKGATRSTFVEFGGSPSAVSDDVAFIMSTNHEARLIVLKVLPDTNCSDLEPLLTKPNTARYKFIYICKIESGKSRNSNTTMKSYGILWDAYRAEEFTHNISSLPMQVVEAQLAGQSAKLVWEIILPRATKQRFHQFIHRSFCNVPCLIPLRSMNVSMLTDGPLCGFDHTPKLGPIVHLDQHRLYPTPSSCS